MNEPGRPSATPHMPRRVNASVMHARRESSIMPVANRVSHQHLRVIYDLTAFTQKPGTGEPLEHSAIVLVYVFNQIETTECHVVARHARCCDRLITNRAAYSHTRRAVRRKSPVLARAQRPIP